MNYRAEVIAGNCTKKNDFVIIYNTLVKLESMWANNHYLMVKCSKMLTRASAHGAAPDLSQICFWMSKYVGIVVDIYEVRSLIRYVNIIINDRASRVVGYCDLHPPPKRDYDQWCSHVFALANQNVTSAKEKQSQAFQQQLEKLTMLSNATEKKPPQKKRKRKKKTTQPGGGASSSSSEKQLPSITEQMFPRASESVALASSSSSSSSSSQKDLSASPLRPPLQKHKQKQAAQKARAKGSGRKRSLASSHSLKTLVHSPTNKKEHDRFCPPPFNRDNSSNPHFDNLADAVVQTQIKKHVDRNTKFLLTTEFPDMGDPDSIDYAIASVTQSSKLRDRACCTDASAAASVLTRPPLVKRAVSFNDQVDEEFFGDTKPVKQYIDKHRLLQDSGVSKMVRERFRFKQESQKVKNEVFATLGL
jgi:hypothetical protein